MLPYRELQATIGAAISIAILFAAMSCSAIKATYTVHVTPATRAMILAQPEFAEVDCKEARSTVVGADVAKNSLLVLSINCVGF